MCWISLQGSSGALNLNFQCEKTLLWLYCTVCRRGLFVYFELSLFWKKDPILSNPRITTVTALVFQWVRRSSVCLTVMDRHLLFSLMHSHNQTVKCRRMERLKHIKSGRKIEQGNRINPNIFYDWIQVLEYIFLWLWNRWNLLTTQSSHKFKIVCNLKTLFLM